MVEKHKAEDNLVSKIIKIKILLYNPLPKK